MPMYQYQCECGHQFDKILKINDRNTPKDEPCPSCNKVGSVEMMISSAAISSSDGRFLSKVPDSFKDRLKEIKKSSGRGCTIDV